MTKTQIIRETELLEEAFAMADPNGIFGAITRIETKLDGALKSQSDRDIATARELALIEASSKSAHKRIDDWEEGKKGERAEKWALRLAVIGTALAVAAAAIGKATGKWIWIVALLPIAVGCGSTEAMKRSVYYDGKALESIDARLEKIATDPAATPAIIEETKAAHVELTNVRVSIPLIQSEIGDPDPATTPPYTPEEHAKTNAEAKKELEDKAGFIDGVWNFVQTTAGKITMGIFGTAIGALVVGWVRSAAHSSKLWTYVKIAGGIVAKSQDLKDQFAAKAVTKGVAKTVDEVVQLLPTPAPQPIPPPPEPSE